MNQDALSPTQQHALGQLQALTNGGDVDVAISVLESVGWDVQRAADVVFGAAPTAPLSVSKSSTSPTTANGADDSFEVDDSEQHGLLSGRPTGREFNRVSPSTSLLSLLMRPLRLIIALLAVPYTILRVVLRTLRVPIPLPPVPHAFSITGLGLSFGGSQRPGLGFSPVRDPKLAAERWVRALEEETGCVCVSRARSQEQEASGVAASSSSVVNRRAGDEAHVRVLPDFFVGSYEAFSKACAKDVDAKIGCVVLVSEEHDDVAEFKRSTLTDPDFVKLIQENDILVWGGDIRDRDAWSAAQKVQATTYPFVAFVALQPRRGPSSASSQKSVLTILSRHQGPSTPTSGPTSAHTLTTHITEQLLPRVTPVLTRIRSDASSAALAARLQAEEREHERALRMEQDRAFAETAARDKARIERKIAEEKAARVEAERRSLEEARVAQDAEREAREKAEWTERRMSWRMWTRRALLPREPRPNEQAVRGRTVRVGVRMPDGARAVRFFGESDSVTAVFAFVDTLFIPKDAPSSADPASPPGGEGEGEAALVREMERSGRTGAAWWGFKLATVYPRREITWTAGMQLAGVEALRNGGQLVVELEEEMGKGRGRASLDIKGKNSDSEYETESD